MFILSSTACLNSFPRAEVAFLIGHHTAAVVREDGRWLKDVWNKPFLQYIRLLCMVHYEKFTSTNGLIYVV